MNVLLDTNRLSDALAQRAEVLDVLEAVDAISIPVIALGEIRAGFLRGRRAAENQTRLQWLLSQPGVEAMSVSPATTHHYAEIHRALRSKGKPIPTNDLWIAALAVQHGLVVYTRDRHFDVVPGLACL